MKTLFDSDRLSLQDAMAMTADSLQAFGADRPIWCIAYSGGKDSTALVAVVIHLIRSGRIKGPQRLVVEYANTRMELPPLHANAIHILEILRESGCDAREVLPPMDDRFFVYMFGRGVPPPSNTFRWCTPMLKVEPMQEALRALRAQAGKKILMLTGVRVGESAARDQRISLSCGKNGAECGQGWFQETTPESIADTLAPLLHWRTCHIWDWLQLHTDKHGLPTQLVAEVYDQDIDGSANEISARTGCVGCNLASQDFSLQRILRRPKYAYLEPLRRLKPLYAELKTPKNRLRKDGSETRKDGSLVSNPMRMGPLTMDARRWGMAQVLAIQDEVNSARLQEPEYLLINQEEQQRIKELIEANTWPQRWDGTEPIADGYLPEVMPDGSVQHDLYE